MSHSTDAKDSPRKRTRAPRAHLCTPLTRKEAKQFERIVQITGLSRNRIARYLGSWAICSLRKFDSFDSFHPAWLFIDTARTYRSSKRVLNRIIAVVGPRDHWEKELLECSRWPDIES